MTNDEHPKDKIKRVLRETVPETVDVADFVAEARKRGREVTPPSPPPTSIRIAGSNNAGVIGNHNHIEIKVSGVRKPTLQVQPGPEHITDTQAAEIQELVAKVVAVSGREFPFVWSALKKAFRFASYRLLARDKYEEVRQYLRKWIASAEAAQGNRAGNSTANRKRLLARIHAEAKKQNGLLDQVKAYAYGQFEVQSLGDLSPDELGEVIRQFNL